MEAAGEKWPGVPVVTLSQAGEAETVVIGVVFKVMKLKPSAMSALAGSIGVEPVQSAISDDDSMWLEDESGRLDLLPRGTLGVHDFVSGQVLAFRGRLDGGKFQFADFVFPKLPAPVPHMAQGKIAFLSAPLWGQPSPRTMRFCRWLADDLPGASLMPKDIGHIVVVGDALGPQPKDPKEMRNYLKHCDAQVALVASVAPLTIIPGSRDPTTFSLPQKPLHRSITKLSYSHGSLQRASNPAEMLAGDFRLIALASQSEQDVRLYSNIRSSLDSVTLCVKSRCLAPTAPDTLCCVPTSGDNDPFVITDSPHVVVVGTDEAGCTVLENGTLIVCLSSFSTTGEVTVVDISTCQFETIYFGD